MIQFDSILLVMSLCVAGLALALWLGAISTGARRARQAQTRALVAGEAKDRFLAHMSHELRSPLTAILGFADLLAADETSPAERAQHARTIRRNGQHLLAIISDVLDLSKIEAGKMSAERLSVSPCELVAEVVALLGPQARAKGLTLLSEFAWPLPDTITTDPLRLRQVLVNLVGNAVKFTQRGGVVIALDTRAGGRGQSLRIRVIDTGIGLSPEQMGRLFGSFAQAEGDTTRRFGGTGLGLNISRQLARLMGGDISVSSGPHAGSTFQVLLPLAGDERTLFAPPPRTLPHEQGPAPAADPSLAGLRVLVVDDGPDNVRLFGLLLTKAGAQVESAPDGHEGVEAACAAEREGRPFDIVLMDVQMPRLDGYQATRLLRERGYMRPIVALTANAMAGDRQRCLAAGCTHYLSKPVDRRLLVETCRRVSSQHARPALTRAA